ncbi:MAG: mitofilin family membrane protein [Asticcacaulis sp.]
MSEPLNPNDSDPQTLPDDELKDWASPKVTNIARLMAFVILPSLFFVILIFAVWWWFTHPDKPVTLTQTPPPAASALQNTPPSTVAGPASAQTDKDAQIAQLQSQIAALQTQARPSEPAPYYSADPGAIARLSARLDQVEANQRLLARATQSAYAARALQLAAQGQAPFLSELAVVEPTLDDPQLAASLHPYAEKGVPSEVALAVSFPKAAARANIAARADEGDNSIWTRLKNAFGSFISIRRTDNPNGQGTQAILSRAEIRLNSGDLKGAVAYLDTLSPTAQKALSPWLEQARARLMVDDATRHISDSALNRLSQMSVASGAPDNGGVL